MECDNSRPAPGWWALTGTPGCGKTAVARELLPRILSIEVAQLALLGGHSSPAEGGIAVDLGVLSRFVRARSPASPVVVVGHLSHLLPIRRVIVLRCHPAMLDGRLHRIGRGTSRDRRENVASEALDLVAGEAHRSIRTVWEIDTSRRSVHSLGQRIARLIERGSGPTDRVDWLSDPTVPALLLRGTG